MFGGGSIQLARVFGVRIGVDVSWFFAAFLIIWSLSGYYERILPGGDTTAFVLAVVSALLFFLSVVLHELGHALVAMRNGIGITGIDLWLFGGVAKMQRDTDSPGVEFRVSAAGPLVTLLIALLCFGIGALASGPDEMFRASFFDEVRNDEATAVLGYLGSINVLLLVFNLIPGFPLDGGRIARAIAWRLSGDRTRATRFAARLGRGFAYAMIAVGAYLFLQGAVVGGVWLVFIGFFLSAAARSAEVQSALTSRIEGLRVADVMDAEPVALPEDLTLDRALEEYFLRYGWPWFPVTDAAGHLTGVVTRDAVEGVPEVLRPSRTVASAMASDRGGSGLRVRMEDPLEALLGLDGLQRLGAIMAVDRDGVLRGVVTADRVRRALRPVTS